MGLMLDLREGLGELVEGQSAASDEYIARAINVSRAAPYEEYRNGSNFSCNGKL